MNNSKAHVALSEALANERVCARFWQKVCIGQKDVCWDWTGGRSPNGYGKFPVRIGRFGRSVGIYAHRLALSLSLGRSVAGESECCHQCDNKLCCNPAHLYEGTKSDNMRDMMSKGRGRRQFGAEGGNPRRASIVTLVASAALTAASSALLTYTSLAAAGTPTTIPAAAADQGVAQWIEHGASTPDGGGSTPPALVITPVTRTRIRCQSGICWTAGRARKLVFTDRFPMPEWDGQCYPPPPVWEIVAGEDWGWGEDAIWVLHQVALEYQRDDVDMGALLASIAKYESGGRIGAKGRAGELGLIQIHKCHRKRMAGMGLDFNQEIDRLRFGCYLITTALDEGKSLNTALRPWTVKTKAMRTYRDLTE